MGLELDQSGSKQVDSTTIHDGYVGEISQHALENGASATVITFFILMALFEAANFYIGSKLNIRPELVLPALIIANFIELPISVAGGLVVGLDTQQSSSK
jgi:hypothetical protein